MKLNTHYAIGNFIRDGLEGGPIRVMGDGTAVRSYLYAADLAVWLWTILLKGRPGRAYNVGSEEAINIRDLAEMVGRHFERGPEVVVMQKAAAGREIERYVPSTARAKDELGLGCMIDLDDAIQRTIEFHSGSFGERGYKT